MRVLLIKTSSMGDVIHTLPALTDAQQVIPGITFDWVVEEGFVEIPRWHPAVDSVIPIAWRRWRKQLFAQTTRRQWVEFYHRVREKNYDLIMDAQGLVKSALFSLVTKGRRAGLDWYSARESIASLFYQKKCTVNFSQHAVVRMRQLFSALLGYRMPDVMPDYGIDRNQFRVQDNKERYIVFLHGTTWATKLWPENYWIALAKLAAAQGLQVKITGGNDDEVARAKRLAAACANVHVLPKLSIVEVAHMLAGAIAAVSVDTGFGHLAAALAVPTVSLYGPTNPEFTGAMGKNQVHLAAAFPCAPCLQRQCTYRGESPVFPACFSTIMPEQVWERLKLYLYPTPCG
ncbi:MAG: lipopolysaccharide heptosyltransferase I [Gammaproteobacteria bacterium RIFCSPHIGHO2_12_FULL_41_20]|nr:MAG: lipopolysaccharide heptosyltransferase I [Gammaproteobacteria bacterium RIFCSPHIGHO2_12_FULL_41_20]